jgi:hypothetical protein
MVLIFQITAELAARRLARRREDAGDMYWTTE